MPDQCPRCAAPIPADAATCPGCGEVLTALVEPPQTVPAPVGALAVVGALVLPVVGTLVVVSIVAAAAFGIFRLTRPMRTPVPPTPTVVAASPPAAPPVIPPQVVRPKIEEPVDPPSVTGFTPPVAGPGRTLVLHGDNLAAVNRVLMVSTRGAGSVPATIVSTDESSVTLKVPSIPFPDDGIILAAFSPGGVAVLLDPRMGNTPWGGGGNLHGTVVRVRAQDHVAAGDHVVMLTESDTEVSLGDDCTAFLTAGTTLRSHGKRCVIYYVPPLTVEDGTDEKPLIQIPALDVKATTAAFRVKPGPVDDDR